MEIPSPAPLHGGGRCDTIPLFFWARDRTVALLFALVLVAYGAVFLQFARQYLRLRREV